MNVRLGQWYFGEQGAIFNQTKSFGKIEKAHEQVHDSIIQAIDYLSLNWENDASVRKQIIVHVEEMESSSQELLSYIDSMIIEKQRTQPPL